MNKLILVAKITSNRNIVGYRLKTDDGQYKDVSIEAALKIADMGYIAGIKRNPHTNRLAQTDGQISLRSLKQIPLDKHNQSQKNNESGIPECIARALQSCSGYESLERIIKSGYKRYGLIQSLNDRVRTTWGKCESHKEDYQYDRVQNMTLKEQLKKFGYDRDGQFFLLRNARNCDWLYSVDTFVYESIADMLIYIDLVFNDGRNLY